MWQRIQTLYLLLASLLFGSMFFLPVATAIGSEGASEQIFYVDKLPYLVFMIIIELAQVFDLISFKVRPLQQRLTTLVALMMLGFQGWLLVDFLSRPQGVVFAFSMVFPLLCVILDVLALRGIISDILVAGSINRIRAVKKRERKHNKKNRKA